MHQEATLVIGSSYEEVRQAASWLRRNVAGTLTEGRSADFELAAFEALTNVVRHAYQEQAGHQIRIALVTTNEQLVLTIEDNGLPFEQPADLVKYSSVEQFEADDLRDSGRGLLIMLSCVDNFSRMRAGNTNRLMLTVSRGQPRRPRSHRS